MSEEIQLMTSRLRTRLDQESGLQNLDQIVEKYGRVEGQQFSFVGHEFQREIIRDTRSRISCRKCSQVGLSETMVQKIAAMSSVLRHKRIIFTLPTTAMATKFSKDRIDGLIEQSDFYSGMVVKANNSASQKKIGSTMLYIAGTFGDSGAISVPAEIVISDEIDFSNQVVLGKLSSRLRHASKDERGIAGTKIEFSTPTVDGYGIDERFQRGHQAYYMVRCRSCDTFVLPDFFEDMIVPGFDLAMTELERRHFEDPRYKFHEAWLKCPCCGNNLWDSLLDPNRREWVAKHPDRWEHSYQVFPWDVPTYNTPASIMSQFTEYKREDDFYNFVIGLPFSSPDNTFLVGDDHRDRVADAELWIYQQCIIKSSTVGGLDVGKTCHLTVQAVIGEVSYVVWAEEIPNTISSPAAPEVLLRFEFFRMRKLCIDAGPDISLVSTLVNAKGLGAITAVEYVRSISGLDIYTETDEGQLIKAERSSTLGELMKRHNAGKIHYARKIVEPIFAHMKVLKKIRHTNDQGEEIERFENGGKDDHYAHSLNYCEIARMAVQDMWMHREVSAPPTVGRLRVGKNAGKGKK